MTDFRSAKDWRERYAEYEPLYEAFTERVLTFLETLIDDEGLRAWHTYSWTLTPSRFESLLRRARREGRRVVDPLNDLGEFAGVALVVWSPGELEDVADIVVREFDVDYAASLPLPTVQEAVERWPANDEPKLEYPHSYYTVGVAERRRRLAEWRAYADLRIEVHALGHQMVAAAGL